MKVLLANKFFFRNGGSEAVFFDERSFLIERGITVCDFSMEDPRNFPSRTSTYFVSNRAYASVGNPVRSLTNGVSLIHSFEAVSKFRKLIDVERPDLVHCHNIYHQLTPSIIGVAKSQRIPVVLTLHDYKAVCPTYLRLRDGKPCSECVEGDFFNVVRHRCAGGSLRKSALLYAEAALQKLAKNYEKVDVVVAPSQFLADSVAARFSRGRVRVLPNGIDTDRIQPSDKDDGYALYLGRLSREKGIETLLKAQHASTSQFPLKICGTGAVADALQRSCPAAQFLGYKSGDELARIIAGSSFVIVPSEWYENCPMSILEAMGYGKPVIASSIGGIPELVRDGETGFLFEPGNVAQLSSLADMLIGDPARRRALGRAARLRLEQSFSLKMHNRQLLSIYEDLVATVATSENY